MEKKELRQLIKARKKAVSNEEKQREGHIVFDTIASLEVFKNAESILLYYSLPDELPTHDVVTDWARKKKIYLPRVNGDDLEILEFLPDQMETSKNFKIDEPTGNNLVSPKEMDLVIVPAVALDRHCHRMGRGKGFYDRLLPKCVKAYTIGVALDCQFFDEIPVEPFDKNMCGVITASHIAFCKA